MMFRRTADKYIDRANSDIADAEARLMHSFTDKDIAAANDQLVEAKRFLERALKAKADWDAVPHDDYDEYPDVPRTSQMGFKPVDNKDDMI